MKREDNFLPSTC